MAWHTCLLPVVVPVSVCRWTVESKLLVAQLPGLQTAVSMESVCARPVWLKMRQQKEWRPVDRPALRFMASAVEAPASPPQQVSTDLTGSGSKSRQQQRGAATTKAKAKCGRRRAIRPVTDLDDKIRDAKAAAKAAAKSLAQARSQARVERKRRAHLVRKAGQ